MTRILIADDQPDVLLALRFLLKAEGFSIESASDPATILRLASAHPPDLVLMDLNYTRDTTSGEEGLDVLAQLQQAAVQSPVIVMTAWGSVELAVEAMRRGARDFVLKPWDNDKLLNTLKKHLATQPAPTKSSHDLDLARQVQAQLLPQRKPLLKTLTYEGHCRQAGAVGGDYYDYLEVGPGRVAFVLADISGKGIAAALLMANLQAALRSLAWQAPHNLPLLLRTVNLQFLESTTPERYATLFFGEYDDDTRTLRYANCGHVPPLLLRAGGATEQLSSTAPVIGLLESFRPDIAEATLAPGDRLAIYSDGITDAHPPAGVEWDEDAFADLLRRYHQDDPARLTARIAAFSPLEQFDDMTLVLAQAL